MSSHDIALACAGFVLVFVIFAVVVILLSAIIWWVIRTDMDIQIDSSEWEEEQ